MNYRLLAAGLFFSELCCGQVGLIPGANDPSKADLKVMTDDRSLISTKIDPFKGQAEGYLVGNDEGSINIKDLKEFMAELMGYHQPSHNVMAISATEQPKRKFKSNIKKPLRKKPAAGV